MPISLITDFEDYYDYLLIGSNDAGNSCYRRMLSDSMSKGSAINFLKSLNVPTIELSSPIRLTSVSDRVVVYTNPKLHNGKGKVICSYQDAVNNYPGCLASPFIGEANGVYIKFLQIGARSFQLVMYNEQYNLNLNPGRIISITEMPPGYNSSISIPIFSIDYIPCGGKMLAVDFNEVQNLRAIGFDKVLRAEEVVAEINKIFRH